MRSKQLLQAFIALVILFGVMSGSVQVSAQSSTPVVVVRDTAFWDATYTGYVSDMRFEKWPLEFTQTENFLVTAQPSSGEFVPVIILLDDNSNEIARASGTLTSTQPAGKYFVQIEPEAGSGFYTLTIRRVDEPSAFIDVYPSEKPGQVIINVGLTNIPLEGYTSAEVTCNYDVKSVVVEDIVALDAFGTDPVSVKNEQENKLIFAIAGSNGQKTHSPTGVEIQVQTVNPDKDSSIFKATARSPDPRLLPSGNESLANSAVQTGTTITCLVRVSTGDGLLLDLEPVSVILDFTPPPSEGRLTGQILVSSEKKVATVNLYDAQNVSVATTSVDSNGEFALTAPAGTYTIVATADGFLRAEGSVTIVSDETSVMPVVTLLAGDIDGNDVIDQFDAMTIGINYNSASPTAADLNSDGTINVLDLELLAANYREIGPVSWP